MRAAATRRSLLGGNPPSVGRHEAGMTVAVVVAHPVAEVVGRAGLVAAPGRHVEEDIGPDTLLIAAAEGGIGVEDRAGLVLIEHAETREVLERQLGHLVVVEGGAVLDL